MMSLVHRTCCRPLPLSELHVYEQCLSVVAQKCSHCKRSCNVESVEILPKGYQFVIGGGRHTHQLLLRRVSIMELVYWGRSHGPNGRDDGQTRSTNLTLSTVHNILPQAFCLLYLLWSFFAGVLLTQVLVSALPLG